MVGRGRNGGRGRGIGRGALLEQLSIQRDELVTPERQDVPPETYPKLEFNPLPITEEKSISQSYMLVVKKEFRDYLQNSEYYIQLDAERPDIDRYSDRYQQVLNNKKASLSLCWSRFPKELHPKSLTKKRKNKKIAPIIPKRLKQIKDKEVNVKDKLEELEKRESAPAEEEEEGGEEEEEEGEHVEEVEEEVDEEMDEGTDYINSYFDNGEDYSIDEDDTLEEGGVL